MAQNSTDINADGSRRHLRPASSKLQETIDAATYTCVRNGTEDELADEGHTAHHTHLDDSSDAQVAAFVEAMARALGFKQAPESLHTARYVEGYSYRVFR